MTTDADRRVFLDGRVTLYPGDCLDVLDRLPANSVDAVITDPPYHFDTIVERFGKDGAAAAQYGSDGVFARASAGFMGKQWDGGDIAFRPETWAKVLRVLKPGGHLAAFSAPKCVHKMAFGIEAAGFEVRDRVINLIDPDERVIAFLESLNRAQADALFRLLDQFGGLGEAFWTFGSGFPKNHDVSKAIDKVFGKTGSINATGDPVKRMIPGADQHRAGWEKNDGRAYQPGDYVPATPEAQQWEGWGTALKPAYEPIVVARKPASESSVARQVLKTGTGGINIDAARVEISAADREATERKNAHGRFGSTPRGEHDVYGGDHRDQVDYDASKGRFPANLTHDGSAAVMVGFPETAGQIGGNNDPNGRLGYHGGAVGLSRLGVPDEGSAARFFYTAKADAHDRIGSGHPTVKPLDLMQWLCRMLCPPGGLILDLFGGTGTTAEAAYREGFSAILIEREEEYQADIARRMNHVSAGPVERRHASLKAKAERRARAGQTGAPQSVPVIDDIFGGGQAQ
jgi:site-specific DNA-methyltransferase (adenine-specific)